MDATLVTDHMLHWQNICRRNNFDLQNGFTISRSDESANRSWGAHWGVRAVDIFRGVALVILIYQHAACISRRVYRSVPLASFCTSM